MRRTSSALLLALVSGCASEPSLTQPLAIRAAAAVDLATPSYTIQKLPSLGGSSSLGNGINSLGWVAGFSNTATGRRHAVLWRNDSIIDLQTLGGVNSDVQWAGLNDHGTVVGISYLAQPDSLPEDWSCAAFMASVGQVCRGFVWQDNVMSALPTFGGTHGFATAVNNRGQVVGWAETPVHDPTCHPNQILQFRAALWDPRAATMRELRPLPGDSATAATAINDRGEAVGISGDCDVAVGEFSARHAVVWRGDSVIQIGNLGGISWHTPMAINDRGDIAGFSNPPGDPNGEFIPHAFSWIDGHITDLKLIGGDDFSQAFALNVRRQVVGRSCGPNGCRALMWIGAEMIQLNARAVLDSGDVLLSARAINDAGQFAGNMFDAKTGKTIAYLATPVGGPR